jgi:acyl carrier protein
MTSRMTEQVLPEADFYSYLSRQLDWDGDLDRDTYLLEDLGLDSVRILEILLLVEDLGVELADEQVPGWKTFGDVYHSYRSAAPESVNGQVR